MSDPTDIKALDEYLKRNSEVSQRYRELGRDEVPPELDQRVLAAARDAVAGERPDRARSWLRWSAPVALAASVVLVVTVVLERGVQDQTASLPAPAADVRQVRGDIATDDKAANAGAVDLKLEEQTSPQPPVVPQAPAATAPPQEALAKSAARAEAERYSAPESKARLQSMRDQRQSIEQGTPVTVVPEPAPAAPRVQVPEPLATTSSLERSAEEADSSADVSEVVVTGRTRRAPGRAVGPRNTVSNSAFIAGARPAADEQRERSDPQAWLEDIRAMRRAGKTAEADREWQRFHEAFPNVQVADDDIARPKP